MPAMLKNERPLMLPTSTRRSLPRRMMSIAAGWRRGNAELAREAIARTGRHDAERRGRAGERVTDLVDGAVAAPGDHHRGATLDGARRELAGVPAAFGHVHVARDRSRRECVSRNATRAAATSGFAPAPDNGFTIATTFEKPIALKML